MIKVVCDRCGREIPVPGRTGYLAWNFRSGHGGDMVGNNVLEDRDYCESCMRTIFGFIDRKPVQADSGTGTENKNPVQETEAGGTGTAGHTADASGSSTGAGEKPFGQQKLKPRKNSVDIGKILALREAGRSLEWIADDMGMSKGAVYNALRRWEAKQEQRPSE